MGDKISNAQGLSQGIRKGFGDEANEDDARKRAMAEDANEMGAWQAIQGMGSDLAAGAKDFVTNPGGVWNDLMNVNGPNPSMKKKTASAY